jgi:alkanesulfonate monooxygenase SsuD/methylene tetrahydromethanopterin reductase-like flavin-dependent oxidoreductase (luciferase family)
MRCSEQTRKEAKMSNQPFQCDLVLPQGTQSELGGSDPASGWRVVEDMARLAVRLGYRGIWAYDRLEPLPRRAPLPVFDGWTTLAALAGTTEQLRLGVISSPAPLRDAALLAKRAACLDVISDGRLTLALDAGYLSEHPAAAAPPLTPAAARSGAAETAAALRMLWTGRMASYQGQHVMLDNLYCHPRPLQERLPLFALGGAETDADSDLFDGIILQETPDMVAQQVRAASACLTAEAGPGGARQIVLLDCRIFDSELERDRWLASPHVIIFWSDHPDLYVSRNLIGTVEAVRDQMGRFLDAGAREFAIYFRDYPAARSAERFMTEVVPDLTVLPPMTPQADRDQAADTVLTDAS